MSYRALLQSPVEETAAALATRTAQRTRTSEMANDNLFRQGDGEPISVRPRLCYGCRNTLDEMVCRSQTNALPPQNLLAQRWTPTFLYFFLLSPLRRTQSTPSYRAGYLGPTYVAQHSTLTLLDDACVHLYTCLTPAVCPRVLPQAQETLSTYLLTENEDEP